MFYVEKIDSQPRVYELTDKVPEATGPYRRYITKFEQTPSFIVHSKMHGTHEKPQPYVVRGVSKRGELLVQATVATEYDPIGRWHEVDCGDTVEGYRFKRYALKPIATLIKMATDAAKAAARDAKKQAQQADRDEKCGTCPVCFGDYVVRTSYSVGQGRDLSTMVHHGYERPGVGYIVGDCHGVNFEPFEISCDGTISWREHLKKQLAHHKKLLANLDTQDSVVVVTGMKRIWQGRIRVNIPEYETIKRGEPKFERAIENVRDGYKRTIESLKRDITTYTTHITNWKPQPFPRKVQKGKAS